jgi:FkbM family methyltransferase
MERLLLLLLLSPVQKIVRTLLNIPFAAPFMWRNVYRVRHFYSTHLNKMPFVANFDGNIKIYVSLSDHIESQIFWQGVQEGDRGEVKLLKSLFAPNHTFIDVGGNIGVFSLIAAKRLTSGKVHTFEPSAYHLEKLRANLLLNKFDNVRVHPVALSNQSQSSKLYFPPSNASFLTNTGMASQFRFDQPPSNTEDIKCVRLDDYREFINLHCVDLIKIDVEGAEIDVLSGAIETIRTYRPHVVMEINLDHLRRAGRSTQEVIDYWNALDYKIFSISHDADLHPIRSIADFAIHQNIYCKPNEQLKSVTS